MALLFDEIEPLERVQGNPYLLHNTATVYATVRL